MDESAALGSKRIPIDASDFSADAPPPEWAMIEVNGELIQPQQLLGDSDLSVEVLGAKGRVELGQISFSSPEVRRGRRHWSTRRLQVTMMMSLMTTFLCSRSHYFLHLIALITSLIFLP